MVTSTQSTSLSVGILLMFLGFLSLSATGQKKVVNNAIGTEEKITYSAYYNWGFVWLQAGTAILETQKGQRNDKPYLMYSITASSYESYDWFFKVRDKLVSWVDPETMLPMIFSRKTYEGGYSMNATYEFDRKRDLIYTKYETSDVPFRQDTIPMGRHVYDLLSGTYYARILDYSDRKIGEKIPISGIVNNKPFDIYFRYLGKDTITLKTNEVFKCHKFSVLMMDGTIFKGGEDVVVWVADDKNKIPVMIEAKILVGSIKAYLTSYKGLLNPCSSFLYKKED